MRTVTMPVRAFEAMLNIAVLNHQVLNLCFDQGIIDLVGASIKDVEDESNALDRSLKLGDHFLVRAFAMDVGRIMREASSFGGNDLGKQWDECASRMSEEAEFMRLAYKEMRATA